MLLDEFQRTASKTLRDLHSENLVSTLSLGLIGEFGGFLSAIKKRFRDESAFIEYEQETLEECGDALWYFAVICEKCDIALSSISKYKTVEDLVRPSCSVGEFYLDGIQSATLLSASEAISAFGWATSKKSAHKETRRAAKKALDLFVDCANMSGVELDQAILFNIGKTKGRWPDARKIYSSLYDDSFPPYEQLPRFMEVEFREYTDSKGVPFVVPIYQNLPLGDRLTDNNSADDGYRFHDVFHLGSVDKVPEPQAN